MNMDFSPWLVDELKNRNWSQADLARHAGISRTAVSDIISQKHSAGLEICNAISRAFKIPPEVVLRKAGLITEAPEVNDTVATAMAIFARLSEEDQVELLAFLRIKDERSKKYRKDSDSAISNTSPKLEFQ